MVDEKLVRVALHELGRQPHNLLHYLVQFDALLARVTEESGQSGSDDQARELVEWLYVWDGDARRNQFHFDVDAWDAIWKIRFRGEHYVDIDRAREFLRYLRKRPNLQPEEVAFADQLQRKIDDGGGRLACERPEAIAVFYAVSEWLEETDKHVVGDDLMNLRSDAARLLKIGESQRAQPEP